MLRRVATLILLAFGLVVASTGTAFAHSGFDPEAVAPGSIAEVALSVAAENDAAGTTSIQLLFPEGQPLTVVEIPPVAGWTATVDGGTLGQPATGITWTRPSGPIGESPVVRMKLGPFPDQPGQIQFKVLQTYADGQVDRWIQDWPAGSPEPEMPGPVLQLQVGAAGEIPPSTSTSSTTTTIVPTTTTSRPAEAEDDDGGSNNTALIIGGVVLFMLAMGATTYFIVRRNQAKATSGGTDG